MAQIYNPSLIGKQILIDIENIDSKKIKSVHDIQPLMETIVEEFKIKCY